MPATEKGLSVIRSFEGRALKAYRDSVGVITIGYGSTNYDKFAVEYLGGPITLQTTITEDQAEYLLRESLARNYGPAVEKAMPGGSAVEHDGGYSFHFNTGAIARASWVKLWKAGADFYASIMSWNKAGGNVLAGLTRRRAREHAIIKFGDYGPEGNTKPPVLNSAGHVVPVNSPDHHLAGTPGMLRLGDQGPEVVDLKKSLVEIGFKDVNPADDKFDAGTDKIIRAIQTAHKQINVDGVVGPATRASINRERDARKSLAKTTTVNGSIATATGAAHTFMHIPGTVWIAIAIFAASAFAVLAWKYRDEFAAIGNRKV
jgi:lysozyme